MILRLNYWLYRQMLRAYYGMHLRYDPYCERHVAPRRPTARGRGMECKRCLSSRQRAAGLVMWPTSASSLGFPWTELTSHTDEAHEFKPK